MIVLCDKLNNLPLEQLEDSIQKHLALDHTLWYLAHEIVFADEDSYTFKGGMDYYIYWDEKTERIFPLEYDGNSSMIAPLIGLPPFFNEFDTRFPLLNRLMAVPSIRQRYLAHVRTILQEYYTVEYMQEKLEEYVDVMAPLVQGDTKKLYTYDEFLSGVEELEMFIEDRHNFLSNHNEVDVESPSLSEVVYTYDSNTDNPIPNEEVFVTAAASATAGIEKVNLYYSASLFGPFDKIQMFDDGNHNDEDANDGIYGNAIPGLSLGTYVRYYVEAVAADNSNTVSYEPSGAEHDVYLYKIEAVGYAESDIVINELVASNDSLIADESGEYDDWIELYNNADEMVDLSGYFLTDDSTKLAKWTFPEGTMIEPNGYLIVWADGNDSNENGLGLHASFKLSKNGETLYLLDNNAHIIEEIVFGEQETDKGYARVPNGTGDFVIQDATFNSTNKEDPGSNIEGISTMSKIKIYPNPVSDILYIETDLLKGQTGIITNILGQEMDRFTIDYTNKINTKNWSSGLYILHIKNHWGSTRMKFVVE